jgi:UDP-N-acetylmuramyl pentapeptide phosphotransferase/UDP-N-acetylglucosamine-1-phosphate transferase
MVSLKASMLTSSFPLPVLFVVWFGLALLLSVLVLHLLLSTGLAARLATDIPNHRSLHVQPIPRVGGWGVIPVSLPLLLIASPRLSGVAAGAAILAVLSHLDDRGGLSAKVRFLVHFLVAATFFAIFPPRFSHWWLLAILTFALVWLINLYNFMDGVDGLAGGMTFFGFLSYALAAATTDHDLAYAAMLICGAAAGFLWFNFHPARIFLGDAGSIPLGFLAGALGYWGWRDGVWSFWFPLLVFAPFIMDASITLLRRVLRGEKFWQAHREHYYQRMVQMGAGHARTALSWYALMAVGAALALLVLHLPVLMQSVVIAMWVIVLFVCGCRIDRQWTRFNQMKASQ